MTRDDYIEAYFKVYKENAGRWLPEEATKEVFFDISQKRSEEHRESILANISGEYDV